jgi:hypothetical protein
VTTISKNTSCYLLPDSHLGHCEKIFWEEVNRFGILRKERLNWAKSSLTSLVYWNRTDLALAQRRFSRRFAEFVPQRFAIVDLGCGDGVNVIELLSHPALVFLKSAAVDVFLVDQDSLAVRYAAESLSAIQIGVNIVPIEASIHEFVSGWSGGPFEVALAASSLHHYSPLGRSEIFAKLGNCCLLFALSELEGNHISLIVAETIREVATFYGGLFTAARRSLLCRDADFCIESFLGAEARQILLAKFEDRGNFHAPLNVWERELEIGGFAVESFAKWLSPSDPRVLSIVGRGAE